MKDKHVFNVPLTLMKGRRFLNQTETKMATMPEDLRYLYGIYFEDYLADVEICQEFTMKNRKLIAEVILGRCGLTAVDAFYTIHNYIDTDETEVKEESWGFNYDRRV